MISAVSAPFRPAVPPTRVSGVPGLVRWCCLVGLLVLLLLAARSGAAQDPGSSGAAELQVSPPLAAPQELAAQIEANLRREGLEPFGEDVADRAKTLDWLDYAAGRAWASLRNVAFTRVTYRIRTSADEADARVTVHVADIAAAFQPATHAPLRMSRIVRHTFPRSEGYPPRVVLRAHFVDEGGSLVPLSLWVETPEADP